MLTGEITSITVVPVAVQPAAAGDSRYALIASGRIEFRDVKTNKVLWSNPAMQFREEYEPSTGSNVARRRAPSSARTSTRSIASPTEFARAVVSAMLEAF